MHMNNSKSILMANTLYRKAIWRNFPTSLMLTVCMYVCMYICIY